MSGHREEERSMSDATTEPIPAVYTLDEASAKLRISSTFLSREFRAGNVPGYRMGRRIFFQESDLAAYQRKQRNAAPYIVGHAD
jgi:excisionase family DNA binding protein